MIGRPPFTSTGCTGGAVARSSGRGGDRLRIAIVAETFLPAVNGVTNSILRVAEHMRARGHEVLIIAPSPGSDESEGCPVVRVPSVELPRYRDLHVGRPSRMVTATLRDFRPHVVHVAAPVMLGLVGIRAAAKLGVPSVAVYQTDLAGFAERYGLGKCSPAVWRWLAWVHDQADLTLAPSTAATWDLRHRGVARVARWMRGVDTERFHPLHHDPELRAELCRLPSDTLVGYVGRLAKEKQVERLEPLLGRPGLSVVVVGDGPARADVEAALPGARFCGFREGADLSRHVASLDVFVHTGVDETFCQGVQEALSSGVPVVAPAAGGPLDLVHHGINGYLWNPQSTTSLIGGVLELAGSPMVRERMKEAARTSVQHRTWATIMDELEGHYRAAVSGLAFAYGQVSA